MIAPASPAIDPDALPPAVREAFLLIQAEVAGLRAQTERQDYLIAELRHALYGKKSEQLDPDARQLAFEDLETAVAEAETAVDASVVRNADGTTRRPPAKRNLGHLPDHPLPGNRMLAFDERGPRIEQVIEPENKVCLCGCTDMVKIGEDRAERLDIVPARFQVIVTVRPKYACRRCDAGISQAPTPHWLIEGGLPTEGTLAHVAPLGDASIACRATGVQIRRSPATVSPVPDIGAWWCQPGPLNPCNMGSGVTACHLAPVVDRMLIHLKRSTRLFMPSRAIAAQSVGLTVNACIHRQAPAG